MKLKATLLTASLLCVLAAPFSGMAQETTTKDAAGTTPADTKKDEPAAPSVNYSGDFWTRSTLTGDWGGIRNELAKKGVTLDMSVTQIGQGVVDGGKSGQWQYGGRGDIILNLDSQKLGLWPGAFLNLEAEGNWASSVNPNTGALMPVNTSQIYSTARSKLRPGRFEFHPVPFAVRRLDHWQVRHRHLHLRRYERVCPRQRRYPVHEHGV